MLSMLVYGSVIVGGALTYMILGNGPASSKEVGEDHVMDTYYYFIGLPLEYQERYFTDNIDLHYYKYDNTVGLTNDRYLNAKHAAEISRRTGKAFTDINKTY